MRVNPLIHAGLPGSMMLPGCVMQETGDHKRIGAKPLVHERYIGGDLYRNGRYIHRHPGRIPPTKGPGE